MAFIMRFVNAFEANDGHAKVVDSRWYEGVKAICHKVQPANMQHTD